jgi:hypothetical protein
MAHSSIGNMTNTQIESGSRHMQQCRTNYDVLLAMAGTEEDLLNNDDKWCMGKDELAVVCNRHLDANSAKTGTKYAYPSVVTTVGDMSQEETKLLASHYHFMGQFPANGGQASLVSQCFPNTKKVAITAKAMQYREFIPVGYSVGRACAHGYKGDTVASVQIGGLRTVMNGQFTIQTGDLIQMYIPDAEEKMFNGEGGRKYCRTVPDIDPLITGREPPLTDVETKRRNFYSRGLGVGVSTKNGKNRIKRGMFSIKPYRETMNDHCLQYYGDKIRVFARAVSSARPFEPVDIMIARQAM